MSRIDRIPKTLTFEDFERMANRKPSLKGNWIYRLTTYFFDPEMKNPYPKFKLDNDTHRLFLSFEEARKYIRDHKDETVYCSIIRQIPVGEGENEYAAEWLCDSDGNLLDYTTTHTYGDGGEASFFGRPETRQRFKEGEIVEVRWGDEIQLAVLYSDVPDVEWCWGVYQRCLQRHPDIPYILDCSDDCTIVVDGPSYLYHSHICPLSLMKLRFPIPDDIRKELETWYEMVKKETGEEKDPHESYPRMKKDDMKCGYSVGEFGELRLYIHFPDDSSNPLILIKDGYGLKVSLQIDRSEYADFENFTDRLSAYQINALQDYLEVWEQGKTKWWYILRDWNEDDDNPPIPLDTPIPDYTKLIGEI